MDNHYFNAHHYFQFLFLILNTSQKTSRCTMKTAQNDVLISTDTALRLKHSIKK